PGVLAEDAFGEVEDLQMVAALPGGAEAGAGRPVPQPRQPGAASIVAVAGALGAAEGLAVDEVGGVEPAAVVQQIEAVTIVPGGDELMGAVELPGGLSALFGGGRRQSGELAHGST